MYLEMTLALPVSDDNEKAVSTFVKLLHDCGSIHDTDTVYWQVLGDTVYISVYRKRGNGYGKEM